MASPIMKSPTYDPSKHDMKAPPPSVASSRSKVASSEIKPAPNSPGCVNIRSFCCAVPGLKCCSLYLQSHLRLEDR